jgi:hypothetical protein
VMYSWFSWSRHKYNPGPPLFTAASWILGKKPSAPLVYLMKRGKKRVNLCLGRLTPCLAVTGQQKFPIHHIVPRISGRFPKGA